MNSVPKNLCEIHKLGPNTRESLVAAREAPRFANLHIRVAGLTDARAGYEFVRLRPGFSQILACTGGSGEVFVDGSWQHCTAGVAYVSPPDSVSAYHVPTGGRWQICWVIFERTERLPTLEPGTPSRLVRMDASGLELAIEGLCHEVASVAETTAVDAWAALVHRQAMRAFQSDRRDTRLDRAWAAVRRDLDGVWTLGRLARQAGMSEESLRRLCHRQFGRSPLAHLTHLRMLFAADLLSCTDEKVVTIANRAGYSDAFAFSNAFKRKFGQPPSRYRARLLSQPVAGVRTVP